ncbi:MAG: ABC transporter ATP-binding protein [Alphaproteobacteria bacterium]|nr:ABC transporter ATP-binding protein [Alphaproteobacteria bacterium]
MTQPLQIKDVHKSFSGRKVLDGINFSLEGEEIFGLIGLNGVGKTTLIKSMLDLINVDEGAIKIFGVSSKNLKARCQLSYLPEKFQPSRYLKGMEYLDLALSYYGCQLNVEKAQAMAAALDLDPKVLGARVGSYSKGMGQKLGLVGAFLVDAAFLVLDEPMSGLDPSARIKLKEQMLASRAAGKTLFFSSHILADIDEVCDRIGVIHDTKLFFIGTPDEFKQQYREASLEKAFLNSISVGVAA